MEKEIKNTSATRWKNSNISLNNYVIYYKAKSDRFQFTIIDLLYISNFKGGNATVNVEADVLENKLINYSDQFRLIDKEFNDKILAELTELEFEKLVSYVEDTLGLCKNEVTAISGFKYSFLSALLHSHFPNLIPILDRRLLINLGLVESNNLQKSGQVSFIDKFYPALLKEVRTLSIKDKKSIRDIDKEYFIKDLRIGAKSKSLK